MTNTYRALDVVAEHYFGEGDFEHEFSPADEQDWLASGHVELVPRTYRQLSVNYSAAEQGQTFDAAYPVEVEAMLIAGGHIERVDPNELPAGNASRDEWAAYALRQPGVTEDDLADEDGKPLGRDALRDKYGSTDPHTEKE